VCETALTLPRPSSSVSEAKIRKEKRICVEHFRANVYIFVCVLILAEVTKYEQRKS